MTRVIEPETDEHAEDEEWVESESDGWEDDEELPPRPRNRLLAPLPIFLIAVLIAAGGFLAGVLIQKGSEDGAPPAGSPAAATFPPSPPRPVKAKPPARPPAFPRCPAAPPTPRSRGPSRASTARRST